MRRYLVTTVVAEVIALVVWLLFFRFGPNNSIVLDSDGRFVSPSGFTLNMDRRTEHEFLRLDMQARMLAFQLDFLDTSGPLVVGLPAAALLALWTWDRRNKGKKPA